VAKLDSGEVESDSLADDSKQRLTEQQLELLEFIYAYRFVTTKQVQTLLNKKQIQQAQQRLNTLLAKQYIGRRFTSEDRLLGRYATYFLLPDGLKLLKFFGHPKALKNMRKDATSSESFMEHCIAICDVAQDLQRVYRDGLRIRCSTKSELMRHDFDDGDDDDYEPSYTSFPQPLPDMYIDYMDTGDGWEDYLLEVWHDTVPFWVYRKRIKYYIEYLDEDERKDVFGDQMPPVLLVCDTSTLQRRVQRYIKRIFDEIYEDELRFLVTNRQILAGADNDTGIWTVVGEEKNEVLKLSDISVISAHLMRP